MPAKTRRRRDALSLWLVLACWASLGAFLLVSESFRRFCQEVARLVQKL